MSSARLLTLVELVDDLEKRGSISVKWVPVRAGPAGAPPAPGAKSDAKEPVLFINLPGHSGGFRFLLGNPDGGEEYQLPFFGCTPTKHPLAVQDDTLSAFILVPDAAEGNALERLQAWIRREADKANKLTPFLLKPRSTNPVDSVMESDLWREPITAPKDDTKTNWGCSVKLNVKHKIAPNGDKIGTVTEFMTYKGTGGDDDVANPVEFNNTDLCVKGQRALGVLQLAGSIRKGPQGWSAAIYAETIIMPKVVRTVEPVTAIGSLRLGRGGGGGSNSGGGGGGSASVADYDAHNYDSHDHMYDGNWSGSGGGNAASAAAPGAPIHVAAFGDDNDGTTAVQPAAKQQRVDNGGGAVAAAAAVSAPPADTVAFSTDLAAALGKLNGGEPVPAAVTAADASEASTTADAADATDAIAAVAAAASASASASASTPTKTGKRKTTA
jgi:hypothetical protein